MPIGTPEPLSTDMWNVSIQGSVPDMFVNFNTSTAGYLPEVDVDDFVQTIIDAVTDAGLNAWGTKSWGTYAEITPTNP